MVKEIYMCNYFQFRSLSIMNLKLAALTLLFPVLVCAQYKNLVFEGAGLRGIAYAGALEEFERSGQIANIEKVGGTSAGAITALCISLGFNSSELKKVIESTDFADFNDGKYLFVGGFHRMKKNFGWYRSKRFERWLEELIVRKTGNSEITFSQLKSAGFKDLYVTATCLNKQKQLVFSVQNYPNMKVKDAVRISMSVPFYFEAVFIDKEGTVVNDPKKRKGADLVFDGGMLSNLPIQIFDSVDASGVRHPNWETLGIRIDSDEQIHSDHNKQRELVELKVNSFSSYIEAFYVLALENLNRQSLTEDDWKRTISVSCGEVGPRIKKLSQEQKLMLVNNGRVSMADYLSTGK